MANLSEKPYYIYEKASMSEDPGLGLGWIRFGSSFGH